MRGAPGFAQITNSRISPMVTFEMEHCLCFGASYLNLNQNEDSEEEGYWTPP
jgi:hypothetical protein